MRSKKHKLTLILASLEAKLPDQQAIAAYQCDDCDYKFATNIPSGEPFCVQCGSNDTGKIEISKDTQTAYVDESKEDEFSAAKCPHDGCGIVNLMRNETAEAFEDQIYCLSCGGEINYDLAGTEEPKGGATDKVPYEPKGEGSKEGRALKKRKPEGINETVGARSDDECEDEDEDDLGGDPLDAPEDDEIFIDDEDEVTMSMLPIAMAQKGNPKIRFRRISNGDTILSFVGDACVARLNKKDSQHADIFDQDSFLASIEEANKVNGLEGTLKNFKFYINQMPVDRNLFKTQEVAQAKQKAESKVLAGLEDQMAQFYESLCTAAAALNKNRYKNQRHVLKEALYNELSDVNVHRPHKLIDRVFANNSDEFSKDLIDLAFSIYKKPADIREEMAKELEVTSYAEADVDDDDDVVGGENLEDKLSEGIHATTDSDIDIDSSRKAVKASVHDIRRGIPRGGLFDSRTSAINK